MDRDVVEVIARFGDTIIDVAHVGPNGAYRIGTAPDANLAVLPGLTSFPIVEGRTLRCPIGWRSALRGATTELSTGAITIAITRTKLAAAPVPPPRIQLRTPLFLAASLLVHVALWLVAVTLEPFEQLPRHKPRPYRVAHIPDQVEKRVPEPPKPKPEPKPVVQPEKAPRVARARMASRERDEREPGQPAAAQSAEHDMGASVAAAVARATQVDIEKYAKDMTPENTHNPDDIETNGFGGHLRMGPGETIKTGAYATSIYNIQQCRKHDPQCSLKGPTTAPYVRTFMLAKMDDIYACYTEHAPGPGTIVLEFTIKGDGAVENARGSGLGETGDCAARIVSEMLFRAQWPRDESGKYDTRVRWPIAFK
jgi:hypothetical protein